MCIEPENEQVEVMPVEALNKREQKLLKELLEWDGKWSRFWSEKTWQSLEAKGLAVAIGDRVSLTDEGRAKACK